MEIESALKLFSLDENIIDEKSIKRQYWKLAKLYHPDLFKTYKAKVKATESFVLISDARDTLLTAIREGKLPRHNGGWNEDRNRFYDNKHSDDEKIKQAYYYHISPRDLYDTLNEHPIDGFFKENKLWSFIDGLLMVGMLPLYFLSLPYILTAIGIGDYKEKKRRKSGNESKAPNIESSAIDDARGLLSMTIAFLTSIVMLLLVTMKKNKPTSPWVWGIGGLMGISYLYIMLREVVSIFRYKKLINKYGALIKRENLF